MDSKQGLITSLSYLLQTVETYKKTANKENLNVQNKGAAPVQVEKPATPLSSENKVVECSILMPKESPKTATKETQSSHPPQPAHPAPEHVTLLVKESGSLPEQLKLVVSMFHIASNIAHIQLSNQKMQEPLLANEEIIALHQFFFNTMMSPSLTSLESKVSFSSAEVLKLVHGEASEKISGFDKLTYGDLKRIIEKVTSHPKIMNDLIFSFQFMQPQPAPMVMTAPIAGHPHMAVLPQSLDNVKIQPHQEPHGHHGHHDHGHGHHGHHAHPTHTHTHTEQPAHHQRGHEPSPQTQQAPAPKKTHHAPPAEEVHQVSSTPVAADPEVKEEVLAKTSPKKNASPKKHEQPPAQTNATLNWHDVDQDDEDEEDHSIGVRKPETTAGADSKSTKATFAQKDQDAEEDKGEDQDASAQARPRNYRGGKTRGGYN